MKTPAVSIVIPYHNDAQYLDECLRSVLAQTFNNWEAIVVDDASTEGNVFAIVERFQDSRIRLIHHKQNRGPSAARNTGVRYAAAQIIVPLDADDKLSPSYLQVVLETLSDPSVSFVYFDIQCFGDSTATWHSRPFDPAAGVHERQFFIMGTAPFRKDVWVQAGGWCEEPVLARTYEDNDFWLSAVEHGFRGVYVAQPLYQYRRSSGTLSAQPRTYVLPTYRRLYERHKDLIVRYSSYPEWMALGWLEVADAYLKLRQPLRAFGCGLWVWMTSMHRRSEAKNIMKSTLIVAGGKVVASFRAGLSKVERWKVGWGK